MTSPHVQLAILCVAFAAVTSGAPTSNGAAPNSASSKANSAGGGRQGKSLGYYDYIAREVEDYAVDPEQDDYVSLDLENDISRAIPTRRRRPSAAASSYNSPIYYIRLPPNPYMFVPGLGYVSQPPPPPQVSPFVNLPLSFVANGKPNTIYQWGSAAMDQFATQAPPTPPPKPRPQPSKPNALPDSTIHRLPGQFQFNGKPNDIFVLRDSYNALYSDALQNFYP